MNTAAEKIRQVVETLQNKLGIATITAGELQPDCKVMIASSVHFITDLYGKALLDAVIGELEVKSNTAGGIWKVVLAPEIAKLKEARTSITNSTHE